MLHSHYTFVGKLLREVLPEPHDTLEFTVDTSYKYVYLPHPEHYLAITTRSQSRQMPRHVVGDWLKTRNFPIDYDVALCTRAERFPLGIVFQRLKEAIAPNGIAVVSFTGNPDHRREALKKFHSVRQFRTDFGKPIILYLLKEPVNG